MAKGRLEFHDRKKRRRVSVILDTGMKIEVPSNISIPEDADGKTVNVDMKGTTILSITVVQESKQKVHKKDVYAKQTSGRPASRNEASSREGPQAPYNFVPLNKSVVTAPEPPAFDKYHPGRRSGYIDIEIETKTPLYIRGNGSDFFSAGGTTMIPGSSVRGMIRTLVEIASFGKFGAYDDRRLYYRAVGEKAKLGMQYRAKMLAEMGFPKVSSGILTIDGNSYRISPSATVEKTQFYRLNGKIDGTYFTPGQLVEGVFEPYLPDCKMRIFSFKKIFFKPLTPSIHKHGEKGERKLRYALVQQISKDNVEGFSRGYIVASGPLGKMKHMQWIINEPSRSGDNAISHVIPEEVIEEYKGDDNREKDADLLQMVRKHPEGVPCFYLEEPEGVVTAIGHTPLFRLPYEYTVGQHIPDNLKDGNSESQRLDFAEAIFGKLGQFATRAFFEEADLLNVDPNPYMPETAPQILSGPKPTTTQHYLNQPDSARSDSKKLNNWNDRDALIRGNKLYWHRDTPAQAGRDYSWNSPTLRVNRKEFEKFLEKKNSRPLAEISRGLSQVGTDDNFIEVSCSFDVLPEGDFKKALRAYILAAGSDGTKSQYTVIKPVAPSGKFRGRIRFDNLSEDELGALLFALDLPEDCCHKLGMAKPLGLGSVRIEPSLFLIDRGNRYGSLFNGLTWNTAVERKANLEEFKNKFSKFIIEGISADERRDASALWDVPRMKALRQFLEWRPGGDDAWLEMTRYKEIKNPHTKENEFRDKSVLKSPEEFR